MSGLELKDKWYYIRKISELDPMTFNGGHYMLDLLDAALAGNTQDVTEEQARIFYLGLRAGLLGR